MRLGSTRVGRVQPIDWQDAGVALENDALKGVHIPKGPLSDMPQGNFSLYYNEYIAYDVANPVEVPPHGSRCNIVRLSLSCLLLFYVLILL
ncbi:hypothetical protein BC835DRAFT_541985 [Cytidiella melzeri]|nr:hypothetical protein BC835DRAFT_541985 [Cytidiella melzeri]